MRFDAAITVGVIVLLLDASIRPESKSVKEPGNPEADDRNAQTGARGQTSPLFWGWASP